MRVVCLYGHFYQPPREHPWLGVVGPDASAAPDHDWNARITRECYGPMAGARVLDPGGRLRDLVNVYQGLSFDVGPTLTSWLAAQAPEVLSALRAADAAALARTGHGSAWAQPYVHAILPLSRPYERRTNVLWGCRDFAVRFGRAPEGMWLPEMAVDVASLRTLAEAGIVLTMLAPHQAARVRPLGAGDDAWRTVDPATFDTRRLYRCLLGDGLSIDIAFRDATISQELAFGEGLRDGARLAERLQRSISGTGGDRLLVAAVDGETFGHHHRFGEMALAFATSALAADATIQLAGPAAFRAAHPPTEEVEIVERTSWSCVHGVARWEKDCGCKTGSPSSWSQAWREPLRTAMDWLRDELAVVYQTRASELLRDATRARERYVECVLDPGRIGKFLAAECASRPSPAETVRVRRCLELARHALLMQTSCGWFFDDLAGTEGRLVLGHAARAIELAGALGRRLEDGFCERLAAARSNDPAQGGGVDVYRRVARSAATPARVAATATLLQLCRQPPRVPGYEVAIATDAAAQGVVGEGQVTELSTGAALRVPLRATTEAPGGPTCDVGDQRFTLRDLFGVQRIGLLERVGQAAAASARQARRTAILAIRPVIDALLPSDTPLPPNLALLLGYEEAEALAHAVRDHATRVEDLIPRAAALKSRGLIFPGRWLADELQRSLEERLAGLPDAAPASVALLDLAAAAGLTLDLQRGQVSMLRWWQQASPGARSAPAVEQLLARMNVAP